MVKNSLHHRPLFRRKGFVVALGVSVVILLTAGVWTITNNNGASDKDGAVSSDPGSYVNLDPPTDQDIKDSENHKKDLANQQSQPSTGNQPGKKQVVPVITNVQASEVNAYVSGVFEDGGTCTVTLNKGSQTITKTSRGFKNVSYTSCEPIKISPALGSGSWTVTLKYDSASSEGQSAPKDYTVV